MSGSGGGVGGRKGIEGPKLIKVRVNTDSFKTNGFFGLDRRRIGVSGRERDDSTR